MDAADTEWSRGRDRVRGLDGVSRVVAHYRLHRIPHRGRRTVCDGLRIHADPAVPVERTRQKLRRRDAGRDRSRRSARCAMVRAVSMDRPCRAHADPRPAGLARLVVRHVRVVRVQRRATDWRLRRGLGLERARSRREDEGSRVVNADVARRLVRFYPRKWRTRYEQEFLALLDAHEPLTWRDGMDILGAAGREWGRFLVGLPTREPASDLKGLRRQWWIDFLLVGISAELIDLAARS